MIATMSDLEMYFKQALWDRALYIGIQIRMKEFSEDEVIINPNVNFERKFHYIKKMYDENLNHKFSPGIEIVDVAFGDSYEEIEDQLIGI